MIFVKNPFSVLALIFLGNNVVIELKAVSMKDNPSRDDVNGVVLKDEYSEVIAEIFPAFSPTMTPDKFREQFPAIAKGICSIIDEHHLHEEGLFRHPGNVATQGVTVSRILEGASSEQLRGFCKNEPQYCSTLKSLISHEEDSKKAAT